MLFYTTVLPAPQMPPLLDTEQGMTSNDMLLTAVVVLASILLLALLAIASLVAFILWKLRKHRDRSGKTVCCCTHACML